MAFSVRTSSDLPPATLTVSTVVFWSQWYAPCPLPSPMAGGAASGSCLPEFSNHTKRLLGVARKLMAKVASVPGAA
jgi:hypothetical protein